MGSPWSFQCRQEELAALEQANDDEATAQSYLDMIAAPNGLLYRYIEQVCILCFIYCTVRVFASVVC